MNIIHSSSLAYNPVAYKKQQAAAVAAKSSIATGTVNAATPNTLVRVPATQALPQNENENDPNQAGMSYANLNTQTTPPWAQKAVNAYTQNHKLVDQIKIAESISGIDLFV